MKAGSLETVGFCFYYMFSLFVGII